MNVLRIIIFLTLNFALLTFNLNEVKAQTIDPSVWQTGATGLLTTSNVEKRTAGLAVTIQNNGNPFLYLPGGATGNIYTMTWPVDIELGEVKVPGITHTLNLESADWAHNQMSFSSNLNMWVSRLSPAVLISNSNNSLRLFSGNLNGAIVITPRTPGPVYPKYLAYSSGGSIRVQEIPSSGTTALTLPSMDNNWILVWYGDNSYFSSNKLLVPYAPPIHDYWWENYAYQADAPILLKFQNNPTSVVQSPEGGIDLTFSTNSGNSLMMPIMGREYPASSVTESWGTSGTLPANILTKINFWVNGNRLCSYPTQVAESYSYDKGTDTASITNNISYLNVCTEGSTTSGFATIPPFLALAKDAFGSNFSLSGTLVDSGYSTEFGPTQGIDNTNTYTWSLSGLKKYTDSTRVMTNPTADISELVQLLTSQIDKFVPSTTTTEQTLFKPWMFSDKVPWEAPSGEIYFMNPADAISSLSEVVTVLPDAQKNNLISYLRNIRTTYPPETSYNQPDNGTVRFPFSFNPSDWNTWRDQRPDQFLTRVPLYSFSGLSKYFQVTGETVSAPVMPSARTALNNDMAETDWATGYWFREFEPKRDAVESTNRLLEGLIGYSRLAKATNDSSEGLGRALLAKAAVTRIAMAKYPRYRYTANIMSIPPNNPSWMAQFTSGISYGYIPNYDWTTGDNDAQQVALVSQFGILVDDSSAFYDPKVGDTQETWLSYLTNPYLTAFRDLTPEGLRILADYAKTDLDIFINKYTTAVPNWYSTFTEGLLAYEHNLNHPVDSYQIFMAKSLIDRETADNLSIYSSIPWLNDGSDFFYLVKLAETIKAYQGWVWEDELGEVTPTPVPTACALTSASWSSVGPMVEGTSVNLTVNTSGDCNGKNIEIKVFDDDGSALLNDEIATLPQLVATGNQIQTSWITTYVNDSDDPADLLGDRLPEYFFEARVVGESGYTNSPYNQELVVTQLPIVEPNGDVNQDSVVNMQDIKAVLQNWGGTQTGVIDQFRDNKINSFDFAYVAYKYEELNPLPSTTPTSTPSATLTSTPSATLSPTTVPTPCALTEASWSNSNVSSGTNVTLTVNGTNCDGQTVNFQVMENDSVVEGLFDEPASSQPTPNTAVITNNTASITWTSQYQQDGAFGIFDPPEFFFTATVGTQSIRSSDPLLTVTKVSGGGVTLPPDTDWYTVGGNERRTSWVSEEVRGPFNPDWYRPIDPYIDNAVQVVATNDTIFVSTTKGLYAFDAANGNQKWVYGTEMPLTNSPTVVTVNGRLTAYVGGYDRRVHAIDANTGEAIPGYTPYEAGAGFTTNPLVVNGLIYIGNRDGYFYAFDAVNGSLRWRFKTDGPINYNAAYKDGVVYIASDDMYAYALNAYDGTQVWKSGKFPGVGFDMYWPVIYTEPVSHKDYVVYSGSLKDNSFIGGSNMPYNHAQANIEMYDIYGSWPESCRYVGFTRDPICLSGPVGNEPYTWATGTSTLRADRIYNYYNSNPTRWNGQPPYLRINYILNRSDGTEVTPYAPFNPSQSDGNAQGYKHPPIVGSDGVLYTAIGYYGGGNGGCHGGISGWKFGTPYISRIFDFVSGQCDEPDTFAAGGNIIYAGEGINNILNGTYGGIEYSKPFGSNEVWGFTPNSLPGSTTKYTSLGIPGKFGGNSGSYSMMAGFLNHTPIPYKGRIYLIVGNVLYAYNQTGRANEPLPTAQAPSSVVSYPVSDTPSSLQQRLEAEVQKMVNAGHLRPGFMDSGQQTQFMLDSGPPAGVPNEHMVEYFHNPAETVAALARTLSYLSPGLQDQVKTYLRTNYGPGATYDLTRIVNVGWRDGAKREAFDDTPEMTAEFNHIYPVYRDPNNDWASGDSRTFSWNFPGNGLQIMTNDSGRWHQGGMTVDSFYGAWKYAEIFPESALTIFDAMKDHLSVADQAGVNNDMTDANLITYPWLLNEYIIGYYGYLQLERLAGVTTDITQSSRYAEYNRLLNLRLNNFTKDPPWDGTSYNHNNALNAVRNFIYLTPELADIFRTQKLTDVQATLDQYDVLAPFWFVSKYHRSYAESYYQPLMDYGYLFQARALITRPTFSELVKYLDIPAFDTGDLYYIQNLTAALSVSGATPVPTNTPGGQTPTPTNTPTPITIPTATPTASPGASDIRVYALGTADAGIYPQIDLQVGGVTVTTFAVDGVMREYRYLHPSKVLANQIRLVYNNDAQARDLRVDRINVDGVDYQTESSSTYSSGHWDGSSCALGYLSTEWLQCNGFFAYDQLSLTTTPPQGGIPTSTPVISPTPVPCSINTVSWPGSSVFEKTTVAPITVQASGECLDKQVSIEVWRQDDALGLSTSPAVNTPNSTTPAVVTLTSTGGSIYTASTSWTADDWADASPLPLIEEDYGFFVRARLTDQDSPTVESQNPHLLYVTKAPSETSLSISNITDNRGSYQGNEIPKYEKYEVTLNVNNTVATNLQMPYDPNPPAGVAQEIGTGITVNAQFSQDNFQTVYTQPAFYYQDFTHQTIGTNRDWIYPTQNYSWKVRFAPPREGNWQYRLTAHDSSGTTTSSLQTFTATTSSNKGFIRVSQKDSRYFEYEDGTYFPSLGYNMNYDHVSWEDPIRDNQANFEKMGQNGIQLSRIWLSEWSIYGSAWNPWTDLRHDFGGYIARTGVTAFKTDPADFGRITLGLAYQEDASGNKNTNWFDACRMTSGFAPQVPLKRNTNYHVKAKYRAYNISGPRDAVSSNYGFVIKMQNPLDGNWHVNCYDPSINNSTGQVITPFAHSNTDWSNLEGEWNSGNRDFMPPLYLALENVISTNPIPRVYIDSVELREVLSDGSLGPDVFSKSSMGHHLYFGQRNSFAFDKVVELAQQNGVYLRPVILEKGEDIFNSIGFDGNWADSTAGTDNANFYGNWRETTKGRWLQQAWWRYLQARWGYSTNIHSWELLNEGNPYFGPHYALTDELGKYMRQFNPNHHMVSTSTWHSFPRNEFWANPEYPDVDFADVHQYIDSGSDPSHFRDSALSTYDVSLSFGAKTAGGANKPVLRGETGFVEGGSTDGYTNQFNNDTQGIWLHKYTWGQINPGGLIESYWYDTQHIYPTGRDLRPVFGTYYNFIKDIPLSNGNYTDAQAISSNTNIRAWGQKDPVLGRAHLWIDNRTHTWNNVVNNPSAVTPQSGTISFTGMPTSNYTVTWVNTYTGATDRTETLNTTDGNISFNITNLATDTAVKVENTVIPSVTPISTATPTNTPTPTPTLSISSTPTSTPSASLTPPVGGGECGLETASALWSTTSTPENTSVSLTVKGNGSACIGQSVEFNIRRNISVGFDEDIAKLTGSFNDQLISTTTWTTPTWFDSCGGIDPRTCDPIYHFDALTGTNSQRSNDLTVTDYTPTASTDWPQVAKDPQHTGYSDEVLGTNFQVAWTYPFQPDRVYPQTQAIIYQGKVFVGTEGANGRLPRMIALYAGSKAQDSRAGTVAWEFPADGPILASAAADNGMVYFATLQGSVYALDMDGNVVWRKQLMQRVGFSTAPVIGDNKILIGGQDGYFYALNPNDGEVVWRYNTSSPIFMTAAYNNGRVFFGTQDMYVYALNTSDGTLSWKSSKLGGLAMKDYWPLVTQGRVIVRPWSNSVNPSFIVFDEGTGAMDTSYPQASNNTMNGATPPHCVSPDGKLVYPSGTIGSWHSGWGLLDLATKAVETISFYTGDGAGGYGNRDENDAATCSQNLIIFYHTWEASATFNGFYDLKTKTWTSASMLHNDNQMSTNTQGGGTNPVSISNGMVYHVVWHELIARTTN